MGIVRFLSKTQYLYTETQKNRFSVVQRPLYLQNKLAYHTNHMEQSLHSLFIYLFKTAEIDIKLVQQVVKPIVSAVDSYQNQCFFF